MGRFVVTTFAASGDPRYSDADMAMVLDLAVRRLVAAEEVVRLASRQLDQELANARRAGQHAQAAEALKNLADRRPA